MNYFLEHNRYMHLIGICLLFMCAWFFSLHKKSINKRLIVQCFLFELCLAFVSLKTSIGTFVMESVGQAITVLYNLAEQAIGFVFGKLVFVQAPWEFIFAVRVLPVVIFFGFLMALLYALGILQRVIAFFEYLLKPILATSGVQATILLANAFLGQTESTLVIRQYIAQLNPPELFMYMVSGMGVLSAALIAVYSSMGFPAQHLFTANMMAIVGTALMARIIYPLEASQNEAVKESTTNHTTFVEYVLQGIYDGLSIALNVGAMLIVFLSLLGLINTIIGYAGSFFGYSWLSLNAIIGFLGAPVGWLLGLQGAEMKVAGELLGIRLVSNEMVAYTLLLTKQLSARAHLIIMYALAGGANISSIAVQLATIGALESSQRRVVARLGWYALLAATLSNLLTACIIGLMI